tara:strand:+ start:2394 stop:3674 length:1281 start_codon:yes stop_codon:yes gene_type:complete
VFIATLAVCFGAYLGGWMITSGHILFTIGGLGLLLFRGPGNRVFRKPCQVRASAWCLLLIALLNIGSMALFLEDYDHPMKELKKMRYMLLPLSILIISPIYGCFKKWGNNMVGAGVISLMNSIVLATVSGLVGYATGYNPLLFDEQPNPTRAGGVYGMVMTYAYSMQFSVLLLLGVVTARNALSLFCNHRERRWVLPWIWAVIIIGIVGLYFSFSRGAVLGLVVGGLVLLVSAKKWKILAGGIALGLVVLCVTLLGSSRFVVMEGDNELNFASRNERFSQWRAASLTFLKHPVTGVGYRQFEVKSLQLKEEFGLPKDFIELGGEKPELVWRSSHAHNNLLEALVATGIFGGIAFLGFCWFWAKEVWNSDLGKALFFPGVVAFLVSGNFENTFTDSEVLTMIMVLYVCSQLVLDWERRSETELSGFT